MRTIRCEGSAPSKTTPGRSALQCLLLLCGVVFGVPGWQAEARADSGVRDLILAAKPAGRVDPHEILRQCGPVSPLLIAQLRLALADPDAFVRKSAVTVLSAVGDVPVRALARALADGEEAVRDAAEAALVAHGPASAPALVELLSGEGCFYRAMTPAARALGKLKSPEGIPALAQALVRCRAGGLNPAVAFESLRQIGAGSILPLIEIAKHRALTADAYFVLLKFDTAEVVSEVKRVMADAGADPAAKNHVAEQAEILLGTDRVNAEGLAFTPGPGQRRPAPRLPRNPLRPEEVFKKYNEAVLEARWGAEAAKEAADRERKLDEARSAKRAAESQARWAERDFKTKSEAAVQKLESRYTPEARAQLRHDLFIGNTCEDYKIECGKLADEALEAEREGRSQPELYEELRLCRSRQDARCSAMNPEEEAKFREQWNLGGKGR